MTRPKPPILDVEDPQQLERAEATRAEVIARRQAGDSMDAIAKALGIGYMSVYRTIRRATLRQTKANEAKVRELMALELESLSHLQESVWPGALDDADPNQLAKLDKVLAIMDRRAKYLGLNAPEKIAALIGNVGEIAGIDLKDIGPEVATELIAALRKKREKPIGPLLVEGGD